MDRYYANLGMILSRHLRQSLAELGGSLEAALEDFEDVSARRRRLDTAGEAEVLACIHRAATLCAHATEAALMANDAAWRHADGETARCLEIARLLVRTIDELSERVRAVQ